MRRRAGPGRPAGPSRSPSCSSARARSRGSRPGLGLLARRLVVRLVVVLVALGEALTDGAAQHADAGPRRDLDADGVLVLVDVDDRAVHAPDREDLVADLERAEQFLLTLPLRPLRPDEEEVEDSAHEHERKEQRELASALRAGVLSEEEERGHVGCLSCGTNEAAYRQRSCVGERPIRPARRPQPSGRAPSAVRPRCRYARSVATRPRGVRVTNPSCSRYGSYTSSIVSVSSPTEAARVDRPTGPPPNRRTIVPRMARSTLSSPSSSTSNSSSPPRATSWLIRPSRFTSAKSRTRRSSRLATRGVPRERRAISSAPRASTSRSRIPAERRTIRARSSRE